MTPQELKASILQLAIQGKLVEQRPEEGTGAELLEKILAAKGAKGAKGAGKGLTRRRGERGGQATPSSHVSCSMSTLPSKTISAHSAAPREEIPDSEKPFDIPESWVWVRLGEVVFNHGQKKPTGDFSYIDIGSIDNKNQRLSDAETIVHPENASPRARKIVQKGDVIYATVRPYLHNVCVIDREFSREPIASTGFAVMACADCLDNKYLFYFLLSPDFDRYANSSENAKGVAYPAISDKRLYDALIPLPPLAEQKRIVAKIEELLPYIDRYEKAWSKLEDFNKRFPGDMQKSLLQMAIQGKLVDQRPEEGTGEELYRQIQTEKQRLIKSGKIKKEKPLPEITPDEIPFDIPESWAWVRLGEMSSLITKGTTPRGGNVSYSDKGVGFLRAENVAGLDVLDKSSLKYIDEKTHLGALRRSILEANDILITIAGTLGRTAIVRYDDLPLNANQAVSMVRLVDAKAVSLKYIVIALNSPVIQRLLTKQRKVTAIPNLTLEIIGDCLIPLPPLAEQKRIVAKLEELLPLCERLK